MQPLRTFINDLEVSPRLLSPPALNYGQLHRWNEIQVMKYRYVVEIEVFCKLTGSLFTNFRAGEIEDSEFGELATPFPVLQQYADLNYPNVFQLILSKPALFEEICLYLDLDLLNSISRVTDPTPIFILHSLDTFCLQKNGVVLTGNCIDSRMINK